MKFLQLLQVLNIPVVLRPVSLHGHGRVESNYIYTYDYKLEIVNIETYETCINMYFASAVICMGALISDAK